MSSPVGAISDVTNFLRSLLRRQILATTTLSADVTLLPPGDKLPDSAGVNLYLYRVVESPSTKNQAWRGNRTQPPSQRPVLGLQLSYLVTPTAPENSGDTAHMCLGAAMLALQENPVLNDVHLPAIPNTQIAAVDADTLPDYILDSYEQVKVTLLPTSIDEISRIWATLNQPYRLSVAYEVSLVEILPTSPTPPRGGIVLSTNVDVEPIGPPLLQELQTSSGPLARLNNGIQPTLLRINGSHLLFDLKNRDVPLPQHRQLPTVRVGGQVVAIDLNDQQLSERSLRVTMPAVLDAGPQVDVRVTLQGKVSMPLTFTVTPWLTSSTPIRTALNPRLGDADGKLVLNGNGFSATPQAVLFSGPADMRAAIDQGATDTKLKLTIPALPANGVYDVRLLKADNSLSNKRTLEVLPLLTNVTPSVVAINGNNVHELTVDGARLNGTDIRLAIDGATYMAPPNAGAARLVYTLGRLLPAGSHSLTLSVDGHVSRPFKFEVP